MQPALAEAIKLEEQQQRVPLSEFVIYHEPTKNIGTVYMNIRDEKGKVIRGLLIDPDEPYPPELQKAIRIIEGKDPFIPPKPDPKPQPQSYMLEKSPKFVAMPAV